MKIQIFKDFLNVNEWEYTQVANEPIYLFGIAGDAGNFDCMLQIELEYKQAIFYSIPLSNYTQEQSSNLLELMNILNNSINYGCFELFQEQKEVRYRTSLSFAHIEVTHDLLHELISLNIMTMDTYLPAIQAILQKNMDAKIAFEQINIS